MTTTFDALCEKRWKVTECFVGPECWCREIQTEDGEDVITCGNVDKAFAEYVVEVHNNLLSSPIVESSSD